VCEGGVKDIVFFLVREESSDEDVEVFDCLLDGEAYPMGFTQIVVADNG
jgi:hypothetical protein